MPSRPATSGIRISIRAARGRLVDPGGAPYGSIGEVHPDVVAAWGLVGRPVIAAVNLPQLLALATASASVQPVPAAQPVDRDLAVVVDDATPLGEVLRLVRLNGGPMLVEVRPFDVYRGPQVGAGRVSYASCTSLPACAGGRGEDGRQGDEQGDRRAPPPPAGGDSVTSRRLVARTGRLLRYRALRP